MSIIIDPGISSTQGRANNKQRVIQLVTLMPGVHLRELQRRLGISFNSTRYNVENLVRSGEIFGQKEKGYLRLYPAGTNEKDKITYSYLRNNASRLILKILVESQGLTNKQISEKTGLAKSTVSEHLHDLIQARIVNVSTSENGRVLVEPFDREYLLGRLNKVHESLLENVTDRFIDLWEI